MLTTFLTVFISVFLAELGDKTQLATVLFASDSEQNRFTVFLASTLALTLSSALAVLVGISAERWLSSFPLKLIAGVGFIIIGTTLVIGHLRAA